MGTEHEENMIEIATSTMFVKYLRTFQTNINITFFSLLLLLTSSPSNLRKKKLFWTKAQILVNWNVSHEFLSPIVMQRILYVMGEDELYLEPKQPFSPL